MKRLMERRSSILSQCSPNRQTQNETASQVHSSTFTPVPGSSLVVDRLVGQGPEIDVRWTGGSPGALGHQDGDHVLPWVGIPGGAQAAVPAVSTGYRRDVVAPGDHGDAEPPAMAVKKARDQAGHR